MQERLQPPVVVVAEKAVPGRRWLKFDNPHGLLVASRPEHVLPSLLEADAALAQGYYLAGYLSYEAALGLDSAFETSRRYVMPLLWLGIYSMPTRVEVPEKQALPCSLRWQAELSRYEYRSAIDHIHSQIAAGYTYQTNFSFRLASSYLGDPWDLFHFLYQNQPSTSCTYIDTGDWVICSASPELFFALDGKTLTVRPMKGTMPRGRWPDEDERLARRLQSSAKDRAENLMIVDMVRNDLGKICQTGSVQVPILFEVERYPTILQMTSTVNGVTDAAFSKIIASLFPCASITGAPKVEAMRIIARTERSPREVYTGAIGYITPARKARFNVAIRTVVIDKQARAARCGIGSGVIWDSTPEKEYQECLLKARFTMEWRNSFQLLETLRWTPQAGFALLGAHLTRLERSAKFFGFTFDRCLAEARLGGAVQNAARVPLKVRILLSAAGDITIHMAPLSSDPIPSRAQVRFADFPVDRAELMLFHKTTNREIYRRLLDSAPDCYDVMLWNKEGLVTELTRFNLIAHVDGKWKTPRVEHGLLRLRGTLCQELLADHLLEKADLTKCELKNSQSIAVLNSVRGLLALNPLPNDTWLLEPLTEDSDRDPKLRPLICRVGRLMESPGPSLSEGN